MTRPETALLIKNFMDAKREETQMLYQYEIWISPDNRCRGLDIGYMSMRGMLSGYDNVWNMRRGNLVFTVATNDKKINIETAQWFARKMVAGEYSTLHIQP